MKNLSLSQEEKTGTPTCKTHNYNKILTLRISLIPHRFFAQEVP